MSEGDGAAEHRLTLAELAAVVKRLNRTSEFGTAVSEILTQVRRASRDAGATADAAFVDALFAAVMRAGTVLKTRHAEGSAGWVQGRELFLEALDGGCFEGRPSSDEDLTKLGALLELTVDAADADPETRPPDKLPSLPRTFEGQLSGEVEREFDRPTRRGSAPSDPDRDPTQPSAEDLIAMLERQAEALAAATTSGAIDEDIVRANQSARRSAGSDSIRALERRSTAPLADSDLASLPERECPICRDDFEAGQRVIKMPCSRAHVFHRECAAEWLARDDSCPMCRSALPVWLGRETQYA